MPATKKRRDEAIEVTEVDRQGMSQVVVRSPSPHGANLMLSLIVFGRILVAYSWLGG